MWFYVATILDATVYFLLEEKWIPSAANNVKSLAFKSRDPKN